MAVQTTPDRALAVADAFEAGIARKELARLLRRGELAIVVGAGISLLSGVPSWEKLVKGCETALGIKPDPKSALSDRMDVVRHSVKGDTSEYKTLIRTVLYGKLKSSDSVDSALFKDRLMTSIGALIITGARVGPIEIVTLNFDDLLERYLDLHGHNPQVVVAPPALAHGARLVRILHVHGSLPFFPNHQESDGIVLTTAEFARMAAEPLAPWPVLLRAILQTKRVLCIGTSLSDFTVKTQLAGAQLAWPRQTNLGYCLDAKISASAREKLKGDNLTPISVPDHNAIPAFLLEVCAEAAAA